MLAKVRGRQVARRDGFSFDVAGSLSRVDDSHPKITRDFLTNGTCKEQKNDPTSIWSLIAAVRYLCLAVVAR